MGATEVPKETLRIKCSKQTRRRFRIFAVSKDMTYEQALTYLLDYYEGKVTKDLSVEAFKR